MNFYLSNGDRISVDAHIGALLEGQRWERRGQTVQRRYWEGGKTRVETLTNVVMGEAAPKGFVWTHADEDWRDFTRANLVLRPRGYHLSAEGSGLTPHQRSLRAKKASEASAAARKARAPKDPDPRKFRGVRMQGNKYRAVAPVRGLQEYLGLFGTKEEAARAYDAALVAQGLVAVNFPAQNAAD